MPYEQTANRIADNLADQLEEAEEQLRNEKRGKKKKSAMSRWEDEYLNAKSQSLSWEEYQRKVIDEGERFTLEQERSKENEFDSPGKDIAYIETKVDSYSTPEQLQRAVQRLIAYALKERIDSPESWDNDEKNPKISPNGRKREYDAVIDEINRLMTAAKGKDVNSPEAQSLKTEMKKLAAFIRPYYAQSREIEAKPFQKIRSIQELCGLIMVGAEERFKTGGKKELVDEAGNFHPENFEAWVRAELVELATDISPNDPFNAFSEIQAQTPFRSINFMTMYKNLSYWRDEKIIWAVATEKDEQDGVTDIDGDRVFAGQRYKKAVEYKENDGYVNLRNHLANELFMFGYLHTFDVEMRLSRGAEAEVPKIIAKNSMKNILTEKRSRMLFLLKLNSTVAQKENGKEVKEVDEILNDKEMLSVGTVGKALRRAMLAYYYLGEIGARPEQYIGGATNMFEEALRVKDENGNIKVDGVEEFYKSIIRHIITDRGIAQLKEWVAKTRNNPNVYQSAKAGLDEIMKVMDAKERKAQGKDEDWLEDMLTNHRSDLVRMFVLSGVNDADAGDFDKGGRSWKEFAADLLKKEWQLPGKDRYDVLGKLNLFSQRNAEERNIKILREAMIDTLKKTENLDKDDAAYAELISNDMWYSMGMSARNDMAGTAFDAWSKIINFMRYRIKQGDERLYPGNIYNMFGIRRIGMTPFEAWDVKRKDGSRTSFLEQLQGGQGNTINLKDIDDFDFEGDAQAHFAGDHVGNGYRMYHWLLEEDLDWADLFTWERGRVKFNVKAANEIMDDKYHTIRYTYDNIGPHYKQMIRSVDYVWDPKEQTYVAVFKNQSLLESMFDEEVRNMGMYERPELQGDKGKKVARNVFAYILAKEILAHTKWNSPKEHWSDEQLALMFDFFRKLTVGGFYKDPETGKIKQVAKFFDWSEIGKIKEHGGRGLFYEFRMVGGQVLLLPIEVIWAIAQGSWKVAKPSGIELELPGVEAIFGRVA